MVINVIIIHNTESTGGTEETFQLDFFEGATGLTPSTAFVPFNNRFGSPKKLDGTFLSGSQGSAFSGGESISLQLPRIGFVLSFPVDLYIPKGITFGVRVTPPAGNTSWKVSAAVTAFLKPVI